MSSIYEIPLRRIDGSETKFEEYRGKIVLVVNVASRCGFSPQYKGLEDLYRRYKDQGLVILGFPCDQFASQEPGSEKEIQEFCELNFGVSFPMFSKINVNGPQEHSLYQFLKKEQKGILGTEAIKWNFTKFLVDRSGRVTHRFSPQTTPAAIENEIRSALAK